MKLSILKSILLILVFSSTVFCDDPPPIGSPTDTTASAATNVTGSKNDWGFVSMIMQQYKNVRNIVRDTYIEVKSWQAIQANWQATKKWFDYNKTRWDKITQTLSNLSLETPHDFLQSARRLEDATRTIDGFVMVEPKRFDYLMETFEGNLSQMLDTATDIAKITMGNDIAQKLPRSKIIWNSLKTWAEDHTLKSNPIDGRYIGKYDGDPSVTPFLPDRRYDLEAWKRKDFLMAGATMGKSHNDMALAKLTDRQEFWRNMQISLNSIPPESLGTNAGQMIDITQRVQLLADQSDLIASKLNEAQLLLLLNGEEEYQITTAMAAEVAAINNVAAIERLMRSHLIQEPGN